MKIIGPASEDDLPSGLLDALKSDPEEVSYCMTCDGLRVRGHECHEPRWYASKEEFYAAFPSYNPEWDK